MSTKICQDYVIDNFINNICIDVNSRKENGKNDAYFDLPDGITHDDIKFIIQKLNDDHKLISRLYSPGRLQIFWDGSPRRNPWEFLYGLLPIMDPDEFIKIYEQISKLED